MIIKEKIKDGYKIYSNNGKNLKFKSNDIVIGKFLYTSEDLNTNKIEETNKDFMETEVNKNVD